jgi:hypothetical protein
MAKPETNPLFTRSEKGRMRKKVAHKIKGAARTGFSKLFGIPLSPGLGGTPATRRRKRPGVPASASGVRGDVISALQNQGYKKAQAEKMVPAEQAGEGFSSLFRRSVAKNPAELIIFGNPEKVYRKSQLRQCNPLPAALISALQGAAGSKVIDIATEKPKREKNLFGFGRKGSTRETVEKKRDQEAHSLFAAGEYRKAKKTKKKSAKKFAREQGLTMEGWGQRAKRRVRKRLQKKAHSAIGRLFNPDETAQAKDLFEKFHKRGPAGVFEMHQHAKHRHEYTILGPLVALGINAEKFDKINPREDDVVQNWDRLPHMAFLSGADVEKVKNVLGDPLQYLKKIAMLASSPNGKQLYVISSDPIDVDVTKFETDREKDFIDLGEATFVVYIAKKPHEVLEWVHTFGEEGGERPRLSYARVSKEIVFIGGSYRVEAPGIID